MKTGRVVSGGVARHAPVFYYSFNFLCRQAARRCLVSCPLSVFLPWRGGGCTAVVLCGTVRYYVGEVHVGRDVWWRDGSTGVAPQRAPLPDRTMLPCAASALSPTPFLRPRYLPSLPLPYCACTCGVGAKRKRHSRRRRRRLRHLPARIHPRVWCQGGDNPVAGNGGRSVDRSDWDHCGVCAMEFTCRAKH